MATGSRDWTGFELSGGRYRVEARIGEGGMGTVYRARDANLDAEVVIKVPLRSMLDDPEFARRFEVEVRSLAKLSHPQIVKISDVGAWDGQPFAVMQYLPGGSLEDRKPSPPDGPLGALDPKGLRDWLPGIAGALDYLHTQGYVHRDVKPGNILFDGLGHPFLSDFGVIKVAASAADARGSTAAMTGTGMVVGTPEYMAPELVMGEAVDGRADQYALAVSAFEMLSGRRPFEDATKTKLLVLQTTKAPPSPTEFSPWITEAISRAVLRGLAKSPGDRYADCASLAEAIVSAVDADFAEKPDVVRFRCTPCGKTLAIPAPGFARLVGSGRPLDCPGCGARVRSGGSKVAASTVVESTPRNRTIVEAIPGRRSATVVEPRGNARATVVERSRTVVERPRTQVEAGLGVASDEPPSIRPDPPKPRRSTALWAAVGGISALAMTAVAGLVVFKGREAPPAPNPMASTAAVSPKAETPREDRAPGDRVGILVTKNEPPKALEPPHSAAEELTTSNPAVGGETAGASLAPADVPGPAAPSMEPAEARAEDGARKLDDDPAETLAAKASNFVDLKDIQGSPSQYPGQSIELRRLYCPIGDGGPGLSRFAEVNLRADRNGSLSVEPTKKTVDLEIDPALARRVDGIQPGLFRGEGPDWLRLAALTVQVVRRPSGGSEDWAVRVIGLEVFRGLSRKGVKPEHSYKRMLKVSVATQTITPDSAELSDDVQKWKESKDRLGGVVGKMKLDFEHLVDKASAKQRGQFEAMQNNMMRQMDQQDLRMKQDLQNRMRRATGSP